MVNCYDCYFFYEENGYEGRTYCNLGKRLGNKDCSGYLDKENKIGILKYKLQLLAVDFPFNTKFKSIGRVLSLFLLSMDKGVSKG